MEQITRVCTCDDFGDGPCPCHQRENELQDLLIGIRNERAKERPAYDAMKKFCYHMSRRIRDDANIRYYCGSMTETLRLLSEALGAVEDRDPSEIVDRTVRVDHDPGEPDVLRMKMRICELVDGK